MSSKSGAKVARPKTRRRDEVLMSAIREATRAELADFGYAGVTYEGVARRAQTSKHVLYRRYSSRAHMVLDALPSLRWQPDEDVVWTQSLRGDLLIVFGVATEMLLAIGLDNYRSLIADADADLFSTLEAQVTSLSERTIYPALERARTRGELGPFEIPDRAATSVAALLRNELVFSRNAADANTIGEILDTVYLPLVRTLSWRSDETPPAQ